MKIFIFAHHFIGTFYEAPHYLATFNQHTGHRIR